MTIELTMEEAADDLTGWELVAIENRFGRLDTLGVGQLMISTVWAFESRTRKVDFQEIGGWTQKQLRTYFKDDSTAAVDGSKSDADGAGPAGSELHGGNGIYPSTVHGLDDQRATADL